MEDTYKELVLDLEKTRGDVRSFVLMDGINVRSLLKTRLALGGIKEKEVDVVLHSPGGQPADAYRLIRTFKNHYETVNIIVPFWAKSAATLFAFGADRLVMHEFGELGPIDAQIRKDDADQPSQAWESALNVQSSLDQIESKSSQHFVNLLINLQNNPDINIGRKQLADMLFRYNANLYAPLLEKIDTYEMGRMARYLDIGKMYAKRILTQYTSIQPEQMNQLLDFLLYECPDHGYVVDYEILKMYLPNVIKSTDEPFGEEYNQSLEKLSRMLIAQDEEIIIGFVNGDDAKTQKETKTDNMKDSNEKNGENATIEEGVKNDGHETTEKTTKSKRPRGRSSKNGNPTEPESNG